MIPARSFPSKVDRWLAVVLVLFVTAMVASAAVVASAGVPVLTVILAPIQLAAAACIVWTVVSTRYTFDGDTLIIRCAFFVWRLKLADIIAGELTRNPASSPALSLDRIALSLRQGGAMLVSPKDKAGFLAELQARQA